MTRSVSAVKIAAFSLAAGGLAMSVSAAAQYNQVLGNNLAKCAPGAGPAVKVTVNGIKQSSGKIRVQSYNGTKADWLEKGRWLARVEAPAKSGTMVFCVPVPSSGTYGIAVRHDVNGNGKTDIREDGGAMSNNPSINIFNLGKPSYQKTAFNAGSGVTSISVTMKYF
ncbi:DUF2141 domain-containing protein [Allopontixanthobacter sediminis]|uniref:DUF2141 domain-containing protein n=1 Tax=Allopontixanthobacter sediminis TaxID=1689985 RepID=A0A845B2J7_9SPHN|nr:DUF2141 domain-containing protein [Allopontixanthobacter sediminis]MXP44640.1 DUF2141 domain-containing protein [Allopontixanthobacter sediminis]